MPFLTARLIVPAMGSGQDRVEVLEIADGLVIVVADGAGGMGGAAEAAEHVIDAVRRAVRADKRG